MRVLLAFVLVIAFAGCSTTGGNQTVGSSEPVKPAETPPKTETETESEQTAVSASETAPSASADVEEPKITYLVVRSTRTLANGVVDAYTVFLYEENTDTLLSESTYLPEASLRKRVTHTYADAGNTVYVEQYAEDGSVESKLEKTYDVESRLVSEVELDALDNVLMSSTYEYDDSGRRTGWQLYDADGAVLSISKYYYAGGVLSRIDNFDHSEELQEYIEYDYDDGGMLLSEKLFDVDGTELESKAFIFTSSDRLSETVATSPGFYRRTKYSYDENGNIIDESIYNRSGALLMTTSNTYVGLALNDGGEI